MMVVVVISSCPPKLRGDLTKWLFEIDTGVYIGNVTARVRDELWDRVVRSLEGGRAIMTSPARNEQRFEIRVHNSRKIPVDFEGITLMMDPAENKSRFCCYLETE